MNTSKEALVLILEKIVRNPCLEDLQYLLSVKEKDKVQLIFDFADTMRKKYCGEGILLRGLIEFSNHCRNSCFYCGLNKNNLSLERYRLSQREMLEAVSQLYTCGIRTLVLQSGEDDGLDADWLAGLIKKIKSGFDIAVTLSVGEREDREYGLWRKAGADRYLLKIETSNKRLYDSLHAAMSFENRLRCLEALRQLGYQVGSGIMVGLKGQTLKDIAQDLMFFKDREFDMLGIGPFIPHLKTPLADQQPPNAELVLKVLALTRIVTGNTHLPATTALGSLGRDWRSQALKCGANVLMPNFTPQAYRKLYEIYPNKRCVSEATGICADCMEKMAQEAGRYIDYGKGDSLKKKGAMSYV